MSEDDEKRAITPAWLNYRQAEAYSNLSRFMEKVVLDPGVEDQRLLVLRAELAGVLKVMSREGDTLSPVLRQAWDAGAFQKFTKNSLMKAEEALVSIRRKRRCKVETPIREWSKPPALCYVLTTSPLS